MAIGCKSSNLDEFTGLVILLIEVKLSMHKLLDDTWTLDEDSTFAKHFLKRVSSKYAASGSWILPSFLISIRLYD